MFALSRFHQSFLLARDRRIYICRFILQLLLDFCIYRRTEKPDANVVRCNVGGERKKEFVENLLQNNESRGDS